MLGSFVFRLLHFHNLPVQYWCRLKPLVPFFPPNKLLLHFLLRCRYVHSSFITTLFVLLVKRVPVIFEPALPVVILCAPEIAVVALSELVFGNFNASFL